MAQTIRTATVAAITFLTLVGCYGENKIPGFQANGIGIDGGTNEGDARPVLPDARADSGPPPDAGFDDRGNPVDIGPRPDVGFPPDATPPDTGPKPDADAPDMGFPPDTGPPSPDGGMMDGGQQPDAGDAGTPVMPCSNPPQGWVCVQATGPQGFTMGDSNTGTFTAVLTHSFYAMENEMTQGEWMALMGSNPAHNRGCGATCPVEQIDLVAVVLAANAMSRRDGFTECYSVANPGSNTSPVTWNNGYSCNGYRVPSEVEWELMAQSPHPSTTDLSDYAWYRDNSGRQTHPVAGKAPNARGQHDVFGNVSEWVWAIYTTQYPTTTQIDPLLSGLMINAMDPPVFRGGSNFTRAAQVTPQHRFECVRPCVGQGLGVRFVRTFQ